MSLIAWWGRINFETQIFIGIICAAGLIFLCLTLMKKKCADNAPTFLTTLGIFATFLAIAKGLLEFDAVNIQRSVPALLESMKTAFWASVFGVGWALLLQIIKMCRGEKQSGNKDASNDENWNQSVLELLNAIRQDNNKNFTNLAEKQKENLRQTLQMSLVGLKNNVLQDFQNNILKYFAQMNKENKKNALEQNLALVQKLKELQEENAQNLNNFSNKNQQALEAIKTDIGRSLDNIHDKAAEIYADMSDEFNEAMQKLLSNQQYQLVEIVALRNENDRNLRALAKAQEESLKQLVEMSFRTVIESLEEVIRDFNNQLTEQFGDNFKELNAAVKDLIVWQENYKEYLDASAKTLDGIALHVEKVGDRFQAVVENSDRLIGDIGAIIQQSEAFIQSAQRLEETLGSVNYQRQAIQEQLATLSSLVSRTADDLPAIEKNILGIAQTMQHSADAFRQQVKDLAESTENQTRALQDGIEDALNQSLTTLGGQLAAMTEKFAHDYNALAEALARISRTAKREW